MSHIGQRPQQASYFNHLKQSCDKLYVFLLNYFVLYYNISYIDWPRSILFISPGDTSDIADVIEETTTVNRTCSADCNPDCSYIWINNTNSVNISYTQSLYLSIPDRYDAGSYSCKAYNKYGELNKIFTLNIRCEFI